MEGAFEGAPWRAGHTRGPRKKPVIKRMLFIN